VAADAAQASPDRFHVALVIDAGFPMAPLIRRLQDVMRGFFDRVVQEGREDRVSLAVVAFGGAGATPGHGEVTRIVSDFRKASGRRALESAMAGVGEAGAPGPSFGKDPLAGLETALNDLRWPDNPYDAKLIILIADDGPLDTADERNSTAHTPESLGLLAASKGVVILPIHVKTPAGRLDHGAAEEAYRTISSLSFNGADNYFDVEAADIADAAETVGWLVGHVLSGLASQQ
jgi:serine/threonine-protein kinase PpkA